MRPDDGLDPARGIVWWISGCLVAWVAVVCGAEYLGYPGLRIVAVLAAVVASGYIAWAIRAARENRK